MTLPAQQSSVFIDKLKLRSHLSDDDAKRLAAIVARPEAIAAGTHLAWPGERTDRVSILLDGWACRYKSDARGERQIVAIHLPGDMIDLHAIWLGWSDHGSLSLSTSQVARVPHGEILELIDDSPTIARALLTEALVDAAIAREWLMNNGRRDAYARVAHLFCELALRMKAIGRCDGGRFELAMSTAELADATGLTPIHMNRTLQFLQAGRLLSVRDREVSIEDWEGLRDAAEFDPGYLYLEGLVDMEGGNGRTSA